MRLSLPRPGGAWRGISLFFAQKTRGLGNQRKFLSIKAKDRPGRAPKNVLTAKMGVFVGRLAEKRGGRSKKKTLFFVFFRFFGIFRPQEVETKDVPPIRPLPKKSCLKAYGRFLGFHGFW